MKRKNNLYKEIYELKNIKEAFEEVCRNTKNKYGKYRNIYKKIKKKKIMYQTKKIKLYSLVCSINNYKTLNKKIRRKSSKRDLLFI